MQMGNTVAHVSMRRAYKLRKKFTLHGYGLESTKNFYIAAIYNLLELVS